MNKPLPYKPLPMPLSYGELKIQIPKEEEEDVSPLYSLLFDSYDSSSFDEFDELPKSKSRPKPNPSRRKGSSPSHTHPNGKSSFEPLTPNSAPFGGRHSTGERSRATLQKDDFVMPPNYLPDDPLRPIKTKKSSNKARRPREGYVAIRIRLDNARIFKLNIACDISLAMFRVELSKRIKLATGVDVSVLVDGCELLYYDSRKDGIRILDQEDWEICKQDGFHTGIKMEMVSKLAKIKPPRQ